MRFQTTTEGKQSKLSPLLTHLYKSQRRRHIRTGIIRLAQRFEGGEAYSVTLRKIFRECHHLDIGMYSHGGCFTPNNFTNQPPGAKIGRYCEIAYSMAAFNANHPMNLKSQHAFFFNPSFGYTEKDLLNRTRLEIGHDVWIGHNAVILPPVSNIGTGAVIGANTVVHQDVPPFAVVSGFPGRVIRYRFDDNTIAKLEKEQWWNKSMNELRPEIKTFQTPLDGSGEIK